MYNPKLFNSSKSSKEKWFLFIFFEREANKNTTLQKQASAYYSTPKHNQSY